MSGIRDPQCRFALASADRHVCRRSTGEPIRLGESCFSEARAQLIGPHRTTQDRDRALARLRGLREEQSA